MSELTADFGEIVFSSRREKRDARETSLSWRVGRMVGFALGLVDRAMARVAENHQVALQEEIKYLLPSASGEPPVLRAELAGGVEEYALAAMRRRGQ